MVLSVQAHLTAQKAFSATSIRSHADELAQVKNALSQVKNAHAAVDTHHAEEIARLNASTASAHRAAQDAAIAVQDAQQQLVVHAAATQTARQEAQVAHLTRDAVIQAAELNALALEEAHAAQRATADTEQRRLSAEVETLKRDHAAVLARVEAERTAATQATGSPLGERQQVIALGIQLAEAHAAAQVRL